MKQFAKLSLCMLIVCMAATTEIYAKKKNEGGKKGGKGLTEFVLTGTITKNEVKDAAEAEEGKKKKRGKKVPPYTLTLEDDTKIAIQEQMLAKNSIDLSEYDGKTVKLTCMGMKKEKGEKVMYRIQTVTSVEAAEGGDDADDAGETEE